MVGGHLMSIDLADQRARRLSGALCLALLGGFIACVIPMTNGLETWTFEGWRQRQLPSGRLQGEPVPLFQARANTASPQLWPVVAHDGAAVYLVDFIYTRCPSVCRALGSEYQQMQRALADASAEAGPMGGVQLVSISFDVMQDSPARLRAYASAVHADPRWWTLGVPATPDDARALLRSLGVVVVPDGQGGFVHNGAIHLLDGQGRLRGLYEPGQWRQALTAARQLAARQGPRQ